MSPCKTKVNNELHTLNDIRNIQSNTHSPGRHIWARKWIAYWKEQYLYLEDLDLNLNSAICYLCSLLFFLLSFLFLFFPFFVWLIFIKCYFEPRIWLVAKGKVHMVGKRGNTKQRDLKGNGISGWDRINCVMMARKNKAYEKNYNHQISVSGWTTKISSINVQIQKKKSIKS